MRRPTLSHPLAELTIGMLAALTAALAILLATGSWQPAPHRQPITTTDTSTSADTCQEGNGPR